MIEVKLEARSVTSANLVEPKEALVNLIMAMNHLSDILEFRFLLVI